jgi:hypothetical protein
MTALTREQLAAMLDEDDDLPSPSFSGMATAVLDRPESAVEVVPVTQTESPPPRKPRSLTPRIRREDCLYFDLETLPDERRLPLFDLPPVPAKVEFTAPENLFSPEEFCLQDIKAASEILARQVPPDEWFNAAEAQEKTGKSRKGIFDKLDERRKQIVSMHNATADRIKLLSVTPMFCRIAAIGFAVGMDSPESITIEDPDDEAQALARLWTLIANSRPLVGFNIAGFDVPVLLARSMILRVPPSRVLDRRKYGSSDILDLAQELYGNAIPKGFGLKPTCRLLGIDVPAGDCDGSQVYQLAQQGEWDKIGEYNRSDVQVVQHMHRCLMSGYFCT